MKLKWSAIALAFALSVVGLLGSSGVAAACVNDTDCGATCGSMVCSFKVTPPACVMASTGDPGWCTSPAGCNCPGATCDPTSHCTFTQPKDGGTSDSGAADTGSSEAAADSALDSALDSPLAVLEAGAEGGGTTDASDSGSPAGSDSSSSSSGGGGTTDAGGSDGGGTTDAGGSSGSDGGSAAPSDNGGGCNVSSPASGLGFGALALAGLAVLGLRRRRA